MSMDPKVQSAEDDLEFAKAMGLPIVEQSSAVDQPVVVHQVGQSGAPNGATLASGERERVRGRYKERWDKAHVWRVYLQCQGRLDLMLESGHPGVPQSKKTLLEIVRKNGFESRLREHMAKERPQEVSSLAQAATKRVERLRQIEDALFEMLTPKPQPDGTMKWPLPPEKFETTMAQFLKLLDRIELLSGGVTSRTEVRQLVQVNMNVVVTTFGQVINEVLGAGLITQKVARQIITKFKDEITKKEIVMDPSQVTAITKPEADDD